MTGNIYSNSDPSVLEKTGNKVEKKEDADFTSGKKVISLPPLSLFMGMVNSKDRDNILSFFEKGGKLTETERKYLDQYLNTFEPVDRMLIEEARDNYNPLITKTSDLSSAAKTEQTTGTEQGANTTFGSIKPDLGDSKANDDSSRPRKKF